MSTEEQIDITDMTVDEFLDLHGACTDGREWAKSNGITSNLEAWGKLPAEWLIWTATSQGVLPDRELRLFACWCARHVLQPMTDDRSKRAVEVAEAYADGNATAKDLSAARAAAGDAARAAAWAAWAAARAAARAAAWAAARAAAWAAAMVAQAAANAAARDASWDASWDAAWDAARAAQAAYLRANCKPNFRRPT